MEAHQRIRQHKHPIAFFASQTKFFGKLNDWKNLNELLPSNFIESKNLKRTGLAGIFAGSLELVKEGNISIKQKNLYDEIFIKENK